MTRCPLRLFDSGGSHAIPYGSRSRSVPSTNRFMITPQNRVVSRTLGLLGVVSTLAVIWFGWWTLAISGAPVAPGTLADAAQVEPAATDVRTQPLDVLVPGVGAHRRMYRGSGHSGPEHERPI